MSSHEFSSAQAAVEAGYPFVCCCGLFHSSVVGAAYCPDCRSRVEDFDKWAYRRVYHATSLEVLWKSPLLAQAEAEEAAHAEWEAEEAARSVNSEPLTFNPFAGAF